jgi:FixJ family two-component response regulator
VKGLTVNAPIVHVVDDDEGIRQATARLLSAAGFPVRTYRNGDDFLASIGRGSAGCIILDVCLPGRTGLELQSELAELEDPLPIIFVTAYGVIPDSVRAIQRGAVDFLVKPVDGPVLLEAVSRALTRDAEGRRARAHRRTIRERYDRLTAREREVFVHLVGGQLNKQVAADLSISERTIKLHRARIFTKLEVGSMAELARLAFHLGIDPGHMP